MVNGDLVISALIAVSTAAGGYGTGKRSANKDAITIASDTVDMLQAQIETLKDDKQEKDAELTDLRARIDILENMVTQRAEVEAVHKDVKESRVILQKIADKVGA